MSKDYIGKKKSGGFFGFVFFCLIAFVLTFVIAYSASSSFKSKQNENIKLSNEEKTVSEELDNLFAEEEEVEETYTKPAEEKVTEELVLEENTQEEENMADVITETEEEVSVSTEPEEPVVPIATGSVINFYDTDAKYSEFYGDWRTHNGVDIAGTEGEPVRVIADGTVIESYVDPSCDGVMIVDHGDFYSVYMGLDSETMEMTGRILKRGDNIGLLRGSILGETAEPHLHFEIVERGRRIDPLKYIG